MRARVEDAAGTLVVFTVLAQAAIGVSVFGVLALKELPRQVAPAVALSALIVGGLSAWLHLGRPSRAGLAVSGVGRSRLSREVVLGGLFAVLLALQLAFRNGVPGEALAYGAAVVGIVFAQAITAVYRLRTVPAWDSWATEGTFLLSWVILGAATLVVLFALHGAGNWMEWCVIAVTATLLQLVLLAAHLWRLEALGGVAAESARIIHTRRRGLFLSRVLTAILGAGLFLVVLGSQQAEVRIVSASVGAALLLTSELMGRVLFYASHRRVGL